MFILLHGPDEFTAHEELQRLRAASDFGYNQDTFSGADVDLATLRNICDTMPFLSAQRLVVLEGLPKRKRASKGDTSDADDESSPTASAPATPPTAPAKTGAKGKKAKSSGPEPRAFAQGLADYVAQMSETTVLVVLVEDVLEATHPLVVAAQRHGKAHTFTPPRAGHLEAWLTRRAAAHSAKLTADAARLLASEVGDNLRLQAGEIDKLSTYVGAHGQIRVEDVRALTPASRQARVFDLTDALARRDRATALALLHELLAAGEAPLSIVGMTAYQTRTLLQVKTLGERGMRAGQIAQVAGLAPFVAERSLGLARQFSFAQLEAAHRHIAKIDNDLKLSRISPELALDLLVVEFGATPSAARETR